MESKRGQVGLDTVKTVMLVLLVVVLIGFALVVILGNLSDSSVAKTSSGSLNVYNETLTTVNELGEYVTANSRPDANCVFLYVLNQSKPDGQQLISPLNYTTDNCMISYVSYWNNSDGLNNTNWIVTYTYTFNEFADTGTNVTGGIGTFFSNTSTWFALLAVVVIILIIAIVIFAVNRFAGGGTTGL